MLKQGIAALSFLSLSVLTLPAFAEVDCSSAQSIDDARNNINSEITIKGLLTGDFTESLGGYFIQNYGALDASGEGGDAPSPSSNISRGIFVVANSLPSGAVFNFQNNQTTEIAVRGTVQEVDSQIRLNSSEAKACGGSTEELPVPYHIPSDLNITDWGAIDWESLEGMRVTFAPMAITNLDKLATHGQLILSPNVWLDAPLQHTSQAQTKQAYNQNHQVIIDDGSNSENPDPLTLAGYSIGFDASNEPLTLVPQAGAVFNDQHIEGIVYQDNEGYRIQTTHLRSVPSITRSKDSSDVLIHNTSEILLAYLNLDHYFNGDSGDFSNSSGAQNNVEYQAQKQKIIAAVRSH